MIFTAIELDFESPNNIYDETRTGARLSLTRALWSDFLIGSVSYTIEDVGISLNGGFYDSYEGLVGAPPFLFPVTIPANVPQAILDQTGDHLFHRFGTSLAYDTRNSIQLPNGGQRTELDARIEHGRPDVLQGGSQNRVVFSRDHERRCD